MKMNYKFLYLMVLLLYGTTLFAQQNTITGTVTDSDGIPLPGVNVIVEGTTTGSLTDFDGNYSINASKGNVLVFSFVGMETVRISVGDIPSINAQLSEVASQLDRKSVV